jgi:O-antigen/teichoic acid export membrane protein
MIPAASATESTSTYQRVLTARSRWLPWVTKGSLAFVDQAAITGSNFLAGILLARWLPPDQYGAYGLAYALFLLLSLVYQALVLDPMGVFGPSVYRNRLEGYLGTLLRIHGALALGVFLVLGLSAGVVYKVTGSTTLPAALAGVTIASPCILLFWLVRRAFYVNLAPQAAASGALLYCLLMLGGMWVVFQCRALSPLSAFLLMALGAMATSAFLLSRLRLTFKLEQSRVNLREIGRQHWIYGRWALAGSVVTWIPWNIYYALLGSFHSMASVGELRAVLNITFLPVAQTYTALSMLFVPYAARLQGEEGPASVKSLTWKITSLFAGGALAYWGLISLLREPMMRLIYAGKYTNAVPWVPWIAGASVFWCATYGPSIGLRAMQSPFSVFVAYSVAGLISLVIGIPATRAFGLGGVVLGLISSSLAAFAVGALLLNRKGSRIPSL